MVLLLLQYFVNCIFHLTLESTKFEILSPSLHHQYHQHYKGQAQDCEYLVFQRKITLQKFIYNWTKLKKWVLTKIYLVFQKNMESLPHSFPSHAAALHQVPLTESKSWLSHFCLILLLFQQNRFLFNWPKKRATTIL